MVVGRTDHLPGGAAPNWVSPKQGSGPMARHAVTPCAISVNRPFSFLSFSYPKALQSSSKGTSPR